MAENKQVSPRSQAAIATMQVLEEQDKAKVLLGGADVGSGAWPPTAVSPKGKQRTAPYSAKCGGGKGSGSAAAVASSEAPVVADRKHQSGSVMVTNSWLRARVFHKMMFRKLCLQLMLHWLRDLSVMLMVFPGMLGMCWALVVHNLLPMNC